MSLVAFRYMVDRKEMIRAITSRQARYARSRCAVVAVIPGATGLNILFNPGMYQKGVFGDAKDSFVSIENIILTIKEKQWH
ncbi:hypothetical protein [Helicobacter vulpis]|uniref:hypothetical protein n=1 Tax=Helicobacter vulpis TaxID=2316076 RepID=UPI000EAD4606|nr:hypothetical protein [Helicobacter vulpis]